MAKPFYVTDIEIFKNFMLCVVIDMNDYLKICRNLDDLPIYDREEVISKVPYRTFIIYNDLIHSNNQNEVDDLIFFMSHSMFLGSFNGLDYDDIIINYLLSSYHTFKSNPKTLTRKLYDLSSKIINYHKANVQDDLINHLKWYDSAYSPVDVQKIFGLNKVMKSLKQTLVNLNWYNILDYDMPDINERDIHLYKGLDINDPDLKRAVSKWDRFVISDYIPGIIKYCVNDVCGTCEIIRTQLPDVILRMTASIKYKVPLLSSSRSNMADKIFIKRYCDLAKITPKQLKQIKHYTKRIIHVKDCIASFIHFNDPELQKVYDFYYQSVLTADAKDLAYNLKYHGTGYTFKLGGLHSVDIPGKFDNANCYIIDADGTSYYPSFVLNEGVYPSHLSRECFLGATGGVVNDRIHAKHIGDKVVAQSLKIVINSGVFGKLGYEFSPFCDREAMLRVTIGCQLTILMLIENVEAVVDYDNPDIKCHVISANTDGIVSLVPKHLYARYFEACHKWEIETRIGLEYNFYEHYIRRDVNSYMAVKVGNKPLKKRMKRKGGLNYKLHIEDLQKGYNAPIVALAVENYFLHGKSIMETLTESIKIEEFLMTTKPDKSFNIVFYEVVNKTFNKTILTENNRYFVSKTGGVLCKSRDSVSTIMNTNKLLGGRVVAKEYLTLYNHAYKVKSFNEFNIKYSYYYDRASKIVTLINLNVPSKMKGVKKYIKNSIDNYKLF